MRLRIGTRGSDLALWQAHHVAAALRDDGHEVEIVVLKTRGDTIDHVPLSTVEGKAFFTAEIEQALLDDRVDLAVHSHKDLATENPAGLVVAAVPPRGPRAERLLIRPEAHDAGAPLLPLIEGARVGTSAPRRNEQLVALRPDLRVLDLRGNVPTRVRRLREGRYEAVVLAAAGLDRLELDRGDLIEFEPPLGVFVPAPAQGALAIQVREEDRELRERLTAILQDGATARAVAAERELLALAGGGCSLPLGVTVADESGGRFVAHAFLGADHPHAGAPRRWARAEGSDEGTAVRAAWETLASGEPTGIGPLAGRRVALVGSGGGPDDGELPRRLQALGARPVAERAIELEDLEAPELEARVAELRSGDALALTSRRAARRLAGLDVPEGVVVAAVGPATASAASAAVGRVDLVGPGSAADLAAALELESGAQVLFPCAEGARGELPDALEARGVEVRRVVLYRTCPAADLELAEGLDARVYLSGSAVDAAAAADRALAEPAPRFALGPSAGEALARAGLQARPVEGAGPEAALRALVRHLSPTPDPEPAT